MTDYEFAKIIVSSDEYRNRIFANHTLNELWIYCPDKKLWTTIHEINDTMIKIIRNHISTNIIYSTSFRRRIMKEQLVDIVDDENQYKKLNSNRHLLPIKGGMIIDSYKCELRQRKKKDYFSYELDVSYLEDASLKSANDFLGSFVGHKQEELDRLLTIFGQLIFGRTVGKPGLIICGNTTILHILERILSNSSYGIKKLDSDVHSITLNELTKLRIISFDIAEKVTSGQLKSILSNDPFDTTSGTLTIPTKLLLVVDGVIPDRIADDIYLMSKCDTLYITRKHDLIDCQNVCIDHIFTLIINHAFGDDKYVEKLDMLDIEI